MKTQVLAALAVMFVAASTGGSALAQSAASANTSKYGIAVVDISYVFKNHQRFRASLQAVEKKFKAVNEGLNSRKQSILTAQQGQAQFKPGSTEFKQRDEQILKMKADLQVEAAQQQKRFAEASATAYYDAYKEINQAISYYAKRNNVALVLRFNGDEADPNNPESVMRTISKPIQFQNQVDITPDILSMLNSSTAKLGGTSTN